MRRIAATLAGLALVMIPSAIAMSSADTAATSAPAYTPVYQQSTQNSAPRFHRGGRHCHHGQGGSQQPQSGGGAPDV